jgi:hypothetical protein
MKMNCDRQRGGSFTLDRLERYVTPEELKAVVIAVMREDPRLAVRMVEACWERLELNRWDAVRMK